MSEQVLVGAWEMRAVLLLPLAFAGTVAALGLGNDFVKGLSPVLNAGTVFCIGKVVY